MITQPRMNLATVVDRREDWDRNYAGYRAKRPREAHPNIIAVLRSVAPTDRATKYAREQAATYQEVEPDYAL